MLTAAQDQTTPVPGIPQVFAISTAIALTFRAYEFSRLRNVSRKEA